jgi:CO dehydrogenase maturation factor
MKIAVTGKGGVGKTTVSAMLCHIFASEGKKVIAVDADPDANLATAIGISSNEINALRPIAELTELIEERTGAKPGSSGGIFKINPRVDDIPEDFGYKKDNITLLIMGKSKFAASGCYCPEHALLRRLLKHIIVDRDEVVIVDMEAGIEHLTRGTAEGEKSPDSKRSQRPGTRPWHQKGLCTGEQDKKRRGHRFHKRKPAGHWVFRRNFV